MIALPALACLVPASAGRAPFAGHVRGGWSSDHVRVAWAGRIAATAGPEEAWEAADALRDALGCAAGEARLDTLAALAEALGAVPARWRDRGDLSLLVAAADTTGISLLGCGFTQVLVETSGGWLAAALPGSPLVGEPGFPDAWPAGQPPLRAGSRFLGLPPGVTLPPHVERACGVRT